MRSDAEFPPISKALLDELDLRFPERSPEPTDAEPAIRHQGGQRSVVRFLKRIYAEQNEHAQGMTKVLPSSNVSHA